MRHPKVTIVGAGQVGATAALLVLMHGLADVVLVDVAEGLPQGKALDLMHLRPIEHVARTVVGTNDYAETAGSDIVVITAGLPRKPGMTREDLLAANSRIVREVVHRSLEASPDALIVCVTNPLDAMCYLAWKESGLPSQRVVGMGGVLDSARFAHAVAEHTGAPLDEIDALVIGAHGDAMVPLPRFTTINGVPITELLPAAEVERLVERTVFGGAEVVALLKTGSAFYAPGAAVATMVRALVGDEPTVLPCCALLRGEYGIEDVYLGVPARLDRSGVGGIVELPLTDEELRALRASAESVGEALEALGLR